MPLLLDEILNEQDVTVKFKGRTFSLFPTLKALLQYQTALEEFKQDQNEEKFAEKLGCAIFGGDKQYKDFNDLINAYCSPDQSKMAWTAVMKKWMDLLGLKADANEEPKKKLGT